MQPIRVMLVDDHAMFRSGLASLMAQRQDVAVVGEAGDGFEALEKAQETHPDIVLMDIRMPRCDGVAGIRLLRDAMPEVKVIALTVSEDDSDLFEAIKAGAHGYLLKNITPEHLFDFIQGAIRGEAPISPVIAARVLREFKDMAQHAGVGVGGTEAGLTSREREILQMVVDGYTNKEIGTSLHIASGTVKNHLHNILEKLQLQNRTQAATYATKAGLVRPPSVSRSA